MTIRPGTTSAAAAQAELLHRPPFLSPGRIAAALCAATYTLAAAVAALVTGNGEFIFYILVMVVLATIIGLIHFKLRLSTGLLWGLTIWGGLHMAGGLVPVPESWPIDGDTRVLYSWWIIPAPAPGVDAPMGDRVEGFLKYDHLVHAFGFGVTAILCWEILRAVAARQGARLRPTLGVLVLLICASTGLGAINEIVEFTATLLGPTNVGGYVNTALDLIANTTGATLAAAGLALAHRLDRRDRA